MNKKRLSLMQFIMTIACIIIIVLVIGGGTSLISKENYHENLTVTEKLRTGGEDSKYLIFTEDTDGNVFTFENTDMFFRGKNNSSDIYAMIKVDKTYNFTTRGWRVPFLSWYENIMKFQEVKE